MFLWTNRLWLFFRFKIIWKCNNFIISCCYMKSKKSIPKLQWWNFQFIYRMDKYFYSILHNGCNYLSILWLNSIHISKEVYPWCYIHQRTGSSLAQVMSCCLFCINNQTNADWLSALFFGTNFSGIQITIQCLTMYFFVGWKYSSMAKIANNTYLFLCHIILSVVVIHFTQVTSCWQIRIELLCAFVLFLSLQMYFSSSVKLVDKYEMAGH